MRFTLLLVATLSCWTRETEGIVRQSHRGHEIRNKYNRGVQTFETDSNDSSSEMNQEMATTLKPLPSTYTVVDWQRYYPFGDKFSDANGTDGEPTTTTTPPNPTKDQPIPENLVYPVYIKVPIRVPLKASYRKPDLTVQGKMIRPRTVRGAKTLVHPHRYKIPPRFMMVRHQLPMRRKFVSYYTKPSYLYKRHPQYIKPMYLRTGIHDYYQKNVYYPLRGQGYAVTEPKTDWYDSGKVKPSSNLV